MRVEALTPSRRDDWLAFFDGPGFDDNPDWRACYCMFFHFEGTNEAWATFCESGTSRKIQQQRIETGDVRGYLAYDGDAVAGWLNAAPRTHYPKLDGFAPIDDREATGNVTCFVIDPAKRRRGIARALLDRACEDFARAGLTVAEAFPPKQTDGSDADSFRGPLSLYQGAGFTIAEELPSHFRVRRTLA